MTTESSNTRLERDAASWCRGSMPFVVAFCVFVVCWGFSLLFLFPGCASTDSNDIIKMILGLPFESDHFRYSSLNSHHPLLYSGFISLIMHIGLLVSGNTTTAVGLCSFAQMVLLAASVAYGVVWLYRKVPSKVLLIMAIAFFALNPLIARLSITLWKDVLFAAAFLPFSPMVFDIACSNGRAIKSVPALAAFCAMCSLVSLLRSNGLIVVVVSLLALLLLAREARRRLLAVVFGLFLVLGIQSAIATVLDVEPPHFSETVSVPLQQLARTVVDEGDLTESEESFISELIPLDVIKSDYNPVTPNPLKFSPDFNDEFLESHKVEFLLTWISVFPKNADSYLHAWIDETRGYWDCRQDSWHVVPAGYDIADSGVNVTESLAPSIMSTDTYLAYQDWAINKFVDLFSVLCNCALLGWLSVVLMVAALIMRRRDIGLMLLPSVALWGTMLLAAPISNEFRYLFALHVTLPICACVLIQEVAHRLRDRYEDLSKNGLSCHGGDSDAETCDEATAS